MMGIDALEGFLPRRCKERHVLIKELVACLDVVQNHPTSAGAADTDQSRSAQPAATSISH
jgi:hypothetical protein